MAGWSSRSSRMMRGSARVKLPAKLDAGGASTAPEPGAPLARHKTSWHVESSHTNPWPSAHATSLGSEPSNPSCLSNAR
eukprot:CAMPEP_0181235760 /NCGR_PEP_ID=MMETSP1096-20121128/37766_1 /TAXON_ID=156174 ORGANISM="Chrysochromulina ericina, Strain CCMP281" /NCGR_SAMPLE_ID=MMETSP1096 /ASSEMBLY_ACC=CAM_ASM_000453 /LENGTH=78 /DNA_ID=CAMNT_0023330799 /DNA_START=129 /DNA_END=361 /DNA_ORIENTATION=+